MRILSTFLALGLLVGAQDPKKKQARGTGQYAQMDHGPFFSGTIDSRFPGTGSLIKKGIVIRLEGGAVCFDTELLKFASGWAGGFLGFPSGRDGIEGQPFADGPVAFGTKPESLGCARAGSFKDPRPIPYGPLPAAWAKYRGLYLHGNRVILSYAVGDCAVLEEPGIERREGIVFFTRTLSLGRTKTAHTLLVCEGGEASGAGGRTVLLENAGAVTNATLASAPPGVRLTGSNGRILLKLPASDAPRRLKLAIWRGEAGRAEAAHALAPPVDPAPFLKGGPLRWREPVVTAGKRGTDPGAYAVDTITVPYVNPWKSYMRLAAFDFFPDANRAAVSTFDGDVWIVSGLDDSLSSIRWKRYATGLFQPLGVKIVGDALYVTCRDQITRLHDLNGDGEADFYENFNNDCQIGSNFHEFSMNLERDAEGNFYFGKSASWPPRVRTPHEGTILKVSPDGKKLEVFATGVRNPNGMSIAPDGRIAVADNEGHWTPACWVGFTRPGAFHGVRMTAHRSPIPDQYDLPICWLPRDKDNSTSDPVWVTSDRWGPLKGSLLVMSYGTCTLFQVVMEETGGVVQGGVIPFPLAFDSGLLRGRFSPHDGQLYVCGLRSWQCRGAREGAFHRVRYTGRPAHRVRGLRVTARGVDLTFTDPLDPGSAADLDRYAVRWWNWKRTGKYGSPEYSVRNPNRKGRDEVEIKSIRLSGDRRTVSIEIPGIRPVMGMSIRGRIKAADGTPISLELYNTIHRVPVQEETVTTPRSRAKFKMVYVKGGRLGDRDIRPFWIGTHEVTWEEYTPWYFGGPKYKVDGVTRPSEPLPGLPETDPKGPFSDGVVQTPRHPALHIGHYGAAGYCEWLSRLTGRQYRLPTEVEWEFAARAGVRGASLEPLDDFAWHQGNSRKRAYPVGSRKPNAWGLYDMLGNAWEHCLEPYAPPEYLGVVRGGGWNAPASELRFGFRLKVRAEEWNESDPKDPLRMWWLTNARFVGFRLVRLTDDGVDGKERWELAKKVRIRNLKVIGKPKRPFYFSRVTGELTYTGDRVVDELEIMVHYLDEDGKPYYEDPKEKPTFSRCHPVLPNSQHPGDHRRPLRKGETREFVVEVPLPFDDVSDLGFDQFGAKVTRIHFAPP